MSVLVWIVEETWSACVDAALEWAPADRSVTLLHVAPGDVVTAAGGAFAGLLGRGHRERDPGPRLAARSAVAGADLLRAAAERLGRPAERLERTGRVEREVVATAEAVHAELLVVARDGDLSRLGPRSLGPATRFVVDHAPCPVLLVWPGAVPAVGSIPPSHPPKPPKPSKPPKPPKPPEPPGRVMG